MLPVMERGRQTLMDLEGKEERKRKEKEAKKRRKKSASLIYSSITKIYPGLCLTVNSHHFTNGFDSKPYPNPSTNHYWSTTTHEDFSY